MKIKKKIEDINKIVKDVKDIKISEDKAISDKIKRFNEKYQCSITNNQIEELVFSFLWEKIGKY